MSSLQRLPLVLLVTLDACAVAGAAYADKRPALDPACIEKIAGLKGTFSKQENVFKVSKPRTDVKVGVDDWTMPPFMGLTSWAAFTPAHGSQVMTMGDTVLFEEEVNPVMSTALDAGLEVTALHNHFFFDHPKVYFTHIGGTGDAGQLAEGVKKVYNKITEIRSAHADPESAFPGRIPNQNSISSASLESVFGIKGQTNNGMFKVVIGQTANMHHVSVGNEMGVNTWAAFTGSDDAAVVDGDFAMREGELQVVLKAMRAAGINIVAIHQHMTEEQPRYMFLHYWSKGRAVDLAKGVKSALDAQAGIAHKHYGARAS
ncbi:DUF1259 domain-containing protein [Paraburkholderia fungorum]|uniref:DUF1259 domain-containing protein n=1 Tax=Paraburkholderia fungorum TaxID=134537 RepID=UPI00161816A1